MRSARVGALLGLAIAAAVWGAPASAQVTVGVSADYLGYDFDAGLGADAAQLFMVPVGVRIAAGSSLTFDVSSAWAEGRVERSGTVMKLSGPVDVAHGI